MSLILNPGQPGHQPGRSLPINGTLSIGGVQLAAAEASTAIRLVSDYLDYVETLPNQAQRVISEIRQLNVCTAELITTIQSELKDNSDGVVPKRVTEFLDKVDQLAIKKLALTQQLNSLCAVHSARLNHSADDFERTKEAAKSIGVARPASSASASAAASEARSAPLIDRTRLGNTIVPQNLGLLQADVDAYEETAASRAEHSSKARRETPDSDEEVSDADGHRSHARRPPAPAGTGADAGSSARADAADSGGSTRDEDAASDDTSSDTTRQSQSQSASGAASSKAGGVSGKSSAAPGSRSSAAASVSTSARNRVGSAAPARNSSCSKSAARRAGAGAGAAENSSASGKRRRRSGSAVQRAGSTSTGSARRGAAVAQKRPARNTSIDAESESGPSRKSSKLDNRGHRTLRNESSSTNSRAHSSGRRNAAARSPGRGERRISQSNTSSTNKTSGRQRASEESSSDDDEHDDDERSESNASDAGDQKKRRRASGTGASGRGRGGGGAAESDDSGSDGESSSDADSSAESRASADRTAGGSGRERSDRANVAAGSAVDEQRFCICNQFSYGEMIACDNRNCKTEWFHFACVKITAKPKGKWYCPYCRGDRPNVLRSELRH